jgi:uncharacterized protein
MSGIDKKVEDDIRAVLSTFPMVDKAVLYGSRAKGNYKNGSDIDLTLFGKSLSLKTLFAIQEKLDELYLPYKFDLSIFSQITNPDLQEHIGRVGKVFYERKSPI